MKVAEVVRRMGLAETYRDRGWDKAVRVTDTEVQRAGPEWLAELIEALLAVPRPTYPQRFGFEVALRRLATTPGDPGRVTFVRRAAARGPAWGAVRYDLPEVAAYLAMAQREQDLLPVFADAEPSDELAACLWQEMVLRTDATEAAAGGFADRLAAAGHPLSVLPRTRTALERETAPAKKLRVGGAVRVTCTAERALGVHPWPGVDADCADARLFELERPLDGFGAAELRALGPRSAGSSFVHVARVGGGDVLRKLHETAASGPVYGPRKFAAYGRLTAWECLGALVGVAGLDVAAIESAAKACTFLSYVSDWHLQLTDSLDTGLAALWPDRRTVTLIAATDSD
ncbi:DUF6183 family protein [Dactylosporangium sp. CS-047395]|uniref:DUF6183 family protein n=1 Tax=Dactylosporangium sp. CS-047395 TaxID=3239936 RepID=UPI003D9171FE